jgi:hypothetical protein
MKNPALSSLALELIARAARTPEQAAAMAAAAAFTPNIRRTAKNVRTHDHQLFTIDQAMQDSSGAFLIGQLENFDRTLNEPLYTYTWSRDINVRPGLSMADDISSWTASSYAMASGTGSGSRKNWVAKNGTVLPAPAVDIGKYQNPLNNWAAEPFWDVFQLAASQRLGTPIDMQLYAAMQMKWNMDTDEQVYVGDTGLSITGLVNNALVANVANQTTTNWAAATPQQILDSVNEQLNSTWTASGFAVMPNKYGVPPAILAKLASTLVSSAGNQSVLAFLLENNIARTQFGTDLQIVAIKWLATAGSAGATRTIAYSDDEKRVRFAMVPLQRTAIQFQGITQKVSYYGKLGGVEVVYPETISYRDGA